MTAPRRFTNLKACKSPRAISRYPIREPASSRGVPNCQSHHHCLGVCAVISRSRPLPIHKVGHKRLSS